MPLAVAAYDWLQGVVDRVTIPVRRQYYVHHRGHRATRLLPAGLRCRLGLDDDNAVGSRRIEIGGGSHYQAGFVHVDVNPRGAHLEARAPAWSLPFPDGWAAEIVSVHALEHVHPRLLAATLTEWRRVLRPAGSVRIHVPNGPAIMEALVKSPIDGKWPMIGSLLGMYCGPDDRSPEALRVRSDHQVVFDRALLGGLLEEAGFVDVRDRTDLASDRHTAAWGHVVEQYSIVFEAVKPRAGGQAPDGADHH